MRFFDMEGLPNPVGTYEVVKCLEEVDGLRGYYEGLVFNSINDAIPVGGTSITQISNRISIWITNHFGSIEGLHVEHVKLGPRWFEVVVFKQYGEQAASAWIVIFDVSALFLGEAALKPFCRSSRRVP